MKKWIAGQSHCVLADMEWTKDADGRKVGHLKHFLVALGMPGDSTKKRGPELNKQLASVKHPERLEQKKLPGKCGSEPFVASKATFRVLYDFF